MKNEDIPERITIDYRRSSLYRVIHVDGVWGGVTAHGNVCVSFFSETSPLPEAVVYGVSPDGTLQDEIKPERVGRTSPVREVEVGIVMNLSVAKSFLRWLGEKIEFLERAQSAIAEKEKPEADARV